MFHKQEGVLGTIVDATEYETEADFVTLAGGDVRIDFTKMKEQSTVTTPHGGGQAGREDSPNQMRSLVVKRYEPTSQDRADARDVRRRVYVLRELLATEQTYVASLVSLQVDCFTQLRRVEHRWTDSTRDLVGYFDELVAVQTKFFGALEAANRRTYLDEDAIVSAFGVFVHEMQAPYAQFLSHFDSFTEEVFSIEPALIAQEATIKDVLIRPVQRVRQPY
eukprot:SAG11_NODE_299_length_11075_cov_15.266764_7_plen_221_part_00